MLNLITGGVFGFLLVFVMSALNATDGAQAVLSDCARNEVFYDARRSPICDRNCQRLERRCDELTKEGVAGCYCRIGYARNMQTVCIPLAQCAKDCMQNEQPLQADDGSSSSLGGGGGVNNKNNGNDNNTRICEKVCGTQGERNCYQKLERRCVCKVDYCRNRNAECVLDF